MREALSECGEQHLVEAEGYLRAEFRFGTPTEIGEIYRALAVRCIRNGVKRVLVKPGDEDPVGERALRDAFTMILLAGIAPGFRIAIVTDMPGVTARYRLCVRDLCFANVDAKLFANDCEAVSWLTHRGGSVQRAA